MKDLFSAKQGLITHIVILLLLNIFGVTFLFADSVITKERTVVKLAEGIYMIRHKDAPDTFPQGNTTVIIGEREVLVVDSCYLPSSAREDIAQIKTWTNKPVRYLVNTHWHYDHTMGNGVYWESFPALAIVAHTETAKQSTGYNPVYIERLPALANRYKKFLEDGKDANGKVLTEGEKRDYTQAIAGIEPVREEFKKMTDRAPNLTFETEMTVDLGNREVQIKHLGRGNTAGDTVIYLPKEKILIAGDLLDHPVPYLGGGYPSELVETLKKLSYIDAETIIPGHGEVLRGDYGKKYLDQVTEFIEITVAQVSKQIYLKGNGPRNLEIVREAVLKEVDMKAWRQKFAGEDKDNQDFFDGFSMPGLITAAYAEVWGR